jgi:hypothetical protein
MSDEQWGPSFESGRPSPNIAWDVADDERMRLISSLLSALREVLPVLRQLNELLAELLKKP